MTPDAAARVHADKTDRIEELLGALDALYRYASDDGCPYAGHHQFARPNRVRLVIETWLTDPLAARVHALIAQWRERKASSVAWNDTQMRTLIELLIEERAALEAALAAALAPQTTIDEPVTADVDQDPGWVFPDAEPPPAAALAPKSEQEPDMPDDEEVPKSCEWAVVNCHMLARRELKRLGEQTVSPTAPRPDPLSIERWEHIKRICELAGAKSPSVLRAAVPTEITGG